MKNIILAIVAVFMFCGTGSSQEVKELPPATEAELKLVRTWLKENTDTGKWEEVKSWAGTFGEKPKRLVRLKYRTVRRGATMLVDQVFTITKDKATYRGDDDDYQKLRVIFFERPSRDEQETGLADFASEIAGGKFLKSKPKK